ncbi:hypothetical protein ZWY2020_029975 [Hordeum vulgare]|nr:hypothetical protein ZWY2020_029975 [Hordeum vulgare]
MVYRLLVAASTQRRPEVLDLAEVGSAQSGPSSPADETVPTAKVILVENANEGNKDETNVSLRGELNWVSSSADSCEEDNFRRYLAFTKADVDNGWYSAALLYDQDENSGAYKHYSEFCQIQTVFIPFLYGDGYGVAAREDGGRAGDAPARRGAGESEADGGPLVLLWAGCSQRELATAKQQGTPTGSTMLGCDTGLGEGTPPADLGRGRRDPVLRWLEACRGCAERRMDAGGGGSKDGSAALGRRIRRW